MGYVLRLNLYAHRHKQKRILLVSYDVAGAEVVSSYCEVNFPEDNIFSVCDGPAVTCLERQGVNFTIIRNSQCFRRDLKTFIIKNKINTAFCSTGVTNYELDAIKELKANSIETFAIVEHWTNYRERFGYPYESWKANLPDKVIFFDDRAVELAKSLGFPHGRILQRANPCHLLLRDKFDLLNQTVKPSRDHFRILYLSDTVADVAERLYGDRNGFGFDEFSLLEDINQQINVTDLPQIEIVVRKHPIEPEEKYQDRLPPGIFLSDAADLLEDVAKADMVIGSFTTALVTAALVGRPSYSYIPFDSLSLLIEGMRLCHVKELMTIHLKDELAMAIKNLYSAKFQGVLRR